MALSFMLSVALATNAATVLVALLVGALLLFAGIALSKKVPVFSGIVTILAAVLLGMDELVQLIVTSGWVELAIFGASAIALASVLDRHGVAIKLRMAKWFEAIGEDQRQIALED